MVALYDAADTANDKLQDLHDLSALLGLFATELQHLTWPTPAQDAISSLAVAARATQTAADRLDSAPTEETAAAFLASVGVLMPTHRGCVWHWDCRPLVESGVGALEPEGGLAIE